VGKKPNKIWFMYAYHRESGEIVSNVWGKRDLKTGQKLRKRIKQHLITYDWIATDWWDSLLTVFSDDGWLTGKAYTMGDRGE
jgi:IS1 family transposase